MLEQLHHQFDILDWESDLAGYKVVILPDVHRLDASQTNKLQSFLAGGGTALLSHESGLDREGRKFAVQDVGIEYLGLAEDKGEYFEAAPEVSDGLPAMVHFWYGQGSAIRTLPGTTMLARIWKSYFDRNYLHFSSHRQTPFEKPTARAAVAQRGSIIYISHPIFQIYARHSYAPHKTLVDNCLNRLLPSRLVKVSAPSTARVMVTQKENLRVVHFLHYAAERRTPDIDIVEDTMPLENVSLALRLDKPPQWAYLAPQQRSLKVDFADGYARVVVPEIRGHQMVAFEL
jgi:hypothetical protein